MTALYLLLAIWAMILVFLALQDARRIRPDALYAAFSRTVNGYAFFDRKGEVRMQNEAMTRVMRVLIGKKRENGHVFWEHLTEGEVRDGCEPEAYGDTPAFRLPDGALVLFEKNSLPDGSGFYVRATDRTNFWTEALKLRLDNRMLSMRNAELEEQLLKLDDTVRVEETLFNKVRIHDVLGERITLLMQMLRKERELDLALFQPFEKGLPVDLLFEERSNASASLSFLREAYEQAGVRIDVEGELPADEASAITLVQVLRESVTNAVRHGYATAVSVRFRYERESVRMEVTNNGLGMTELPPEGSGTKGMRMRVIEMGGDFAREAEPEYTVIVRLPLVVSGGKERVSA